MIKFFIEMAYWAAYYMKWKSEKEIPFSSGVFYMLIMFWIHITTLLCVIQIYSAWGVVDDILGLLPTGFMKKENKWLMYLYGMPTFLLLQWFCTNRIYSKISKKGLIEYFQKMPLQRQTKGKAMFIVYSVVTVVVALFFTAQVANQREFQASPELSHDIKHSIELILQYNAEDSINIT